jgi:hypothetical protein
VRDTLGRNNKSNYSSIDAHFAREYMMACDNEPRMNNKLKLAWELRCAILHENQGTKLNERKTHREPQLSQLKIIVIIVIIITKIKITVE